MDLIKHPEFGEVRTVIKNRETWFVAQDVRQSLPQQERAIIVTGANDNMYMFSILKAVQEFIAEDVKGNRFAELRLANKIEASRTLFEEQRQDLRTQAVTVKLVEF